MLIPDDWLLTTFTIEVSDVINLLAALLRLAFVAAAVFGTDWLIVCVDLSVDVVLLGVNDEAELVDVVLLTLVEPVEAVDVELAATC